MKFKIAITGFITSLFFSPMAYAEAVYKTAVKSISGNRLVMRYTNDPGSYSSGEGICIYRNRKTVACGNVILSDANNLEVRIMRGTDKFMPDERLLVRGSEKYNLASEKTDAASGQAAGTKPPITKKWNVSSGVLMFAPATFFMIPLTIERAVGLKTTIGIEPFYATSGPGLTMMGATAFLHYYFRERYRKLYFFLGLGYFSVNGKATDDLGIEVTEKVGSIGAKFGLGNRWVFGKSINLSIQGGGLFMSKTDGDQLNFGYNKLSGLIGLQLGILF